MSSAALRLLPSNQALRLAGSPGSPAPRSACKMRPGRQSHRAPTGLSITASVPAAETTEAAAMPPSPPPDEAPSFRNNPFLVADLRKKRGQPSQRDQPGVAVAPLNKVAKTSMQSQRAHVNPSPRIVERSQSNVEEQQQQRARLQHYREQRQTRAQMKAWLSDSQPASPAANAVADDSTGAETAAPSKTEADSTLDELTSEAPGMTSSNEIPSTAPMPMQAAPTAPAAAVADVDRAAAWASTVSRLSHSGLPPSAPMADAAVVPHHDTELAAAAYRHLPVIDVEIGNAKEAAAAAEPLAVVLRREQRAGKRRRK